MIFVFTGKGKGKTTSAIGLAIRAVGADKRVFMAQFLKSDSSSEIKIIKKIRNFQIQNFGRPGFGPYSKKDADLAQKAMNSVQKAAASGRYHILILDEINLAIKYGLIELKEAADFLERFRNKLDLVLTGRYCPKEIIKMADLVTEFKEIKHYFKKGVKARKGIEF